ncbi:MAG: endonuclease/exonuclease/phosphatase family protein [Phycisphaerae bacterium]|nr:endonuclease/exonuclease/phosphatase family protein [Phycisphaerae bacterium]
MNGIRASRRTFWVLAVFSCLSLLGGVRVHAESPAAPDGELVVMSFNIRYGTANDGEDRWANRRQMVCDVIAEHRPDVLGLQEALKFQIDEIMAAVPGYVLVGVGREDGKEKGEYSCILYRSDRLEVKENGTFWLSDTPDVPGSITWGNACTRVCSWGRFIDRATGGAFYVYNTHLDHVSQPAREKGSAQVARHIAEKAKGAPYILTGDFNAGEDNRAIRYLKGEQPLDGQKVGVLFRDAFRIVHPDEKVVGTFNGFKGRTDGAKIDYIFIGSGWNVRDAAIVRTHVDGRYPSDHFPLTARLRVQPQHGTGAQD